MAATPLMNVRLASAETLPDGGQVEAGSATITQPSTNDLMINQTSDRAVIGWDSFSIGTNGAVIFNQPTSNSATLNRVNGSTTSNIAGQIRANGQVYLINPNGILITPTGSVNTNAFVGSSLDMSNSDFQAGNNHFKGKGSSADVINRGQITTKDGGVAVLLGGHVENSGTIEANEGAVGLASGEDITLDLTGDGLLSVTVPTSNANETRALISQSGKIKAKGGRVELRAASSAMLPSAAIHVTGAIEADSVSQGKNGVSFGGGSPAKARIRKAPAPGKAGTVVIDAGSAGTALVSGSVTANSDTENGGMIGITGRDVQLRGAVMSATGATGGGLIEVGGSAQGKGPLANASSVFIDALSRLDVSARDNGSGGQAVVWSDQDTEFRGTIDAKGGAHGGDGGNVEVSGKERLAYAGLVNTLAAKGKTGNLLLDPYDVTISTGANTNQSGFAATGTGSIINITTLQTALAASNVTVSTGASGAETGNITVANALTWAANTTLTLTAAGGIILNAGITNSGATSGLILNSGTGGISGTGAIANSGALTFSVTNASAAGTLSGVISGAGSLVKSGSGTLTLSGANTNTGTTTVNGGTLQFAKQTSLYNGTTASWTATNITVASGATLAVNYLGAGEFTSANLDTLKSLGTATGGFQSGSALGIDTSSGSQTYASTIANTNAGANVFGITKLGTNTLTISGAKSYTGTTNVNAGTLKAGATTAFGATSAMIVASGATLDLSGFANSIGSLAGAGTVTNSSATAATLTAGADNSSTTFSGIIQNGTGAIALTKSGTGILTLSGANSYTGATTVNAGTLSAGSATGFGSNSAVTVGAAGTIDLNGNSVSIGSLTGSAGAIITNGGATAATLTAGALNTTTTYAGILQNGTGGLSLTKAGTGTLTLSGVNTYTGDTSVTGGLTIGTAGSLGSGAYAGNISLAAASTLTYGSSATQTFSGVLSGAGNLTKATSTTAILTLTGTNTFTGNITVSAGKLTLGSGGSLGSGSYAGTIALSAATSLFYSSSANQTLSGVISGAGSITKDTSASATLTLSGVNTYTGTTTINAGTLSAGNAAGFGSNSAVTVGAAGTVDLNGNSVSIGSLTGSAGAIITNNGAAATVTAGALNTTTTYAGILRDGTGILGLTKAGTGTLTLSGVNTYTGDTSVTGGLTIGTAGSLGSGSYAGNISLAAASTLTYASSANQTLSGVLSGAGNISKTTSTTAVLTLSGANTFSGSTTNSAGSVAIGSSGSLGGGDYAGAITLSGTAKLIYGGSAAQIFSGVLTTANTPSLQNTSTSMLTLSNSLVLGAASTLTLLGNGAGIGGGTQNTTISGVISGSGALAVGNGAAGSAANVVLSGNNTFTGAVSIGGANSQPNSLLTISHSNALGTGAKTFSSLGGGELHLQGGITLASTISFSVSGNFTQNGNATVNNYVINNDSGNNTILGSITNAGGNGDTRIISNSGTLNLNGNIAASTTGRTFVLNGLGTIIVNANISDGTSSMGVGIGDNGQAATVSFNGNNTYTGATTVTTGTLKAGSSTAFGTNSAVTTGSSGTLDLAGNAVSIGSLTGSAGAIVTNSNATAAIVTTGSLNTTTTFAGILQDGTGTLSLSKAGTGTMTLSGANTYTGGTNINGGVLSLGSIGAIGSSGTISFGGGALQYSAANTTDYSNRFSGAGSQAWSIDTNGQTISFANALVGAGSSLAKSGTGSLTLSGANTYTGTTSVSAGTLQFAKQNSLYNGAAASWTAANITVSSAATLAVNYGGSGEFTSSDLSTLSAIGTATTGFKSGSSLGIDTSSGSQTYANVLANTNAGANSLGLVKLGANTLTLTAVNTYTGATSVNGGSLVMAGSGSLGSGVYAGAMAFSTGTSLIYSSSANQTLSGIVSGAGNVTKDTSATSTLTLSGANTYTGSTAVNAGKLVANINSVQNGISTSAATIAAGATLQLNKTTGGFSNTYANVFSGSGTLNINFNGGTATNNLFTPNISGLTGTISLTAPSVTGDKWYFPANTTATIAAHVSVGSGTTLFASAASNLTFAGGIDVTGSGNNEVYGAIRNDNSTIDGDIALLGNTTFGSAGVGVMAGNISSSSASAVTLTSSLLATKGLIFTGAISNGSSTLSFVKSGLGTTTLSGANSYTGTTTVSSGTLTAGSETAFGSNSALTVGATGTLDLSGNSYSFGSLTGSAGGIITNSGATAVMLTSGALNTSTTYAGILQDGTGGLGLTKVGTGTLTLTGANTYTGDTNVNAGVLVANINTAQNGISTSAANIAAGATLQLKTISSGASTVASNTFSGAGTLNINFNGGTNPSNFSTPNISGLTGTLALTAGSTTGDKWKVTATNATIAAHLSIGTGTTFHTAFGQTLTFAGGIDVTGSGNNEGYGAIRNGGSTINGDITLLGSATFGTISSGGTITGNIRSASASAVSLTSAAYLGATNGQTFTGAISNGTSTLSLVSSTGITTLSGANSYTGTTNASSGTLIAGSATAFGSNSALTVGATGTLDLNGNSVAVGSLTGSAGGIVTNNGATAATLSAGSLNTTTGYDGILQDGTGILGFSKTGTGKITLGGINTYTGDTSIAGTISLNASGVLGSGSYAGAIFLSSGGILYHGSNPDQILSGVISGNGTISKIGTSATTLTLSGANTYTGFTIANNGIIKAASATAFGSNTAFNVGLSGLLDLNGYSVSVGALTGQQFITNTSSTASTLTVGGLNTSTAYDGIIQNGAGTVALTKVGTGTLTLTGANTYTGDTNVNAGVLIANVSATQNAISSSAANIAAGATLQLNKTSGWVTTYNNVFSGAGTLNLNFSDGATTSGTSTPNISGLTGKISLTAPSTTGDKWFFLTGTTATIAAHLSIGSGTTFSASNSNMTFSGGIDVTGSGSSEPYGAIRNDSATINADITLLGNTTFGALGMYGIIAGTIRSGSASAVTLTSSPAATKALTFTSAISNGTSTLNFVHSGTATTTLSGANSYTGTTNVSTGTLIAGSATAFGSNSALTVGATGTLNVNGNSVAVGSLTGSAGGIITNGSATAGTLTSGALNSNTTYAGTLQDGLGTFGLGKAGTGTLTLSGTNTYSGPTSVSGGYLIIGSTSSLNGGNYAGAINLSGTSRFVYSGLNPQTLSGTISMSGPGALWNKSAAMLNVTGNINLGSNVLSIYGNGDATVNPTFNTTISGIISGSGGLSIGTFTSGVNMLISGNNTFTGNVDLPTNNTNPFSILTISNSNALGVGTKTITNNKGGELHLRGGITLADTLSFVISGNGTQNRILTNHYVIYNDDGDNAINGSLSLFAGNGPSRIISTSGTLALNGIITSISGGRTLTLNGPGTIRINGNISDGVDALPLIIGDDGQAGTVILAGNNTYTGSTTVLAGRLTLSGSLNVGAGTATTAVSSGAFIDGAGVITAQTLSHSGLGSLNLSGDNQVDTLATTGSVGSLAFKNANSLVVGSIDAPHMSIVTSGATSDLTLASGAILSASDSGTPVVLAAGGNFINNSGSSAISLTGTGTPNWQIYSASPYGNIFGGLDSQNTAVWNTAYGQSFPETGNRYIFAYQPTVTFTSLDATKDYGMDNSAAIVNAYTVSGLETGQTGAYLGDTYATVFSGNPFVTSAGADAAAVFSAIPYQMLVNPGTVTSLNRYAFVYNSSGLLTIPGVTTKGSPADYLSNDFASGSPVGAGASSSKKRLHCTYDGNATTHPDAILIILDPNLPLSGACS